MQQQTLNRRIVNPALNGKENTCCIEDKLNRDTDHIIQILYEYTKMHDQTTNPKRKNGFNNKKRDHQKYSRCNLNPPNNKHTDNDDPCDQHFDKVYQHLCLDQDKFG